MTHRDITDTDVGRDLRRPAEGPAQRGQPVDGHGVDLDHRLRREGVRGGARRPAREAGREHPARILLVVTGRRPQVLARRRGPDRRGHARRGGGGPDARRGGRAPGLGDPAAAAARLAGGDLVARAAARPARPTTSWPQLAVRRLTDAARRAAAARRRCWTGPDLPARRHRPGLDPADPRGGRCWPRRWTSTRPGSSRCAVEAERRNPSADLLAAWLQNRLKVPVTRTGQRGSGHHRGPDDHRGGRHRHHPARRAAGLLRGARAAGAAGGPEAPGDHRPDQRGAAPDGRTTTVYEATVKTLLQRLATSAPRRRQRRPAKTAAGEADRRRRPTARPRRRSRAADARTSAGHRRSWCTTAPTTWPRRWPPGCWPGWPSSSGTSGCRRSP